MILKAALTLTVVSGDSSMTTLIVNNKPVRIHPSTVMKVQRLIERDKSTGEIAELIRFTRPVTQASNAY